MNGWTKLALAEEVIRLSAPDCDPHSERGQKAVERLLKHKSWDELADRFHENVAAYLVLDCEWHQELFAEPGEYQHVYQVI